MPRQSVPFLVRGALLGGALFGPFVGVAHAGSGGAPPAEPTYDELKSQLQTLQERVHALESHAEATDETLSAAEVDATVDSVLRDADRRSQLLAADGGFTAGYDKGFFIGSGDGNFLLKPSLWFQFRNTTSFNEGRKGDTDGNADGRDEVESGFELRRARFRFDGNAFTPKLTYSFVWDTNRSGGAVSLLDAWFQYQFAGDWAVKGGQFKENVFQERNVSGFSQLAVDRSLTDAVLGGTITDRVQGLSLLYGNKENPFRAEIAYHDGANSRNTNFTDGPTNWGAGGRAEYKLFGDWADYKDFTAKNGKDDLFVVGAGFDYTERPGSAATLATVDAQYEVPNGLNLFGALLGSFTDVRDDDADGSRQDYGALAQAGYLLNPSWEVFGRYDVVQIDDDFTDGGEDTFHEFTVGANYYLGPDGSYLHKAKVSVDLSYLPNGAPSDQSALGVFGNEGEQFVLRAQFQLVI